MKQLAYGIAVAIVAAAAIGQETGIDQSRGESNEGGAREWRGRMPHREHLSEEGGAAEGLLLKALERPEVVAKLGITEATVKALRESAETQRTGLVDLRGRMEKAALAQARLLAADDVDEAAVMAAVEELGALRTEMAKLRIRQLLLIKQHLSPEQLAKVRELLGRRRGRDDADRGPGLRRLDAPDGDGAGGREGRPVRDRLPRPERPEPADAE